MQNDFRNLTNDELSAVSGGFAWLPAVGIGIGLFVAHKMADKIAEEGNLTGKIDYKKMESYVKGKQPA